jgi:Bromodomain
LRLPPAELYPDYYQVIKRPLSFEQIVDKLHAEEYKTLDEVRQDCETVCNNAKRYNQRDSTIWVLAKRLHVSCV